MNELMILIELVAAPGIDIQDGTNSEDNATVTDSIVAALAQLVRDAYANEQRMRGRLRIVQSPGDEAETMAAQDEPAPQESAKVIEEPERRKSA